MERRLSCSRPSSRLLTCDDRFDWVSMVVESLATAPAHGTAQKLQRRVNCNESSPTHMCPICEKEVETIEHILFRCSWAVTVWFGSGLSYWVQDQWIETTDKWVEEVLCGRLGKEAGLKDYHCPWEIEVVIADVKRWAAQREWSFSWVNREKNRVAHWLASQSLARNFVYSPDCILPDMEILLAKDKPP